MELHTQGYRLEPPQLAGRKGDGRRRAHTKPARGAAESASTSWWPTQQATTAAELGSAGGMKAALDTRWRTTGGGLAADRQCSSQAPSAKSTQICSPRTSASTARTRERVAMGSMRTQEGAAPEKF